LDAIGMISESPSGYYEFLDVYCTTTPSVSTNSILQIYDSAIHSCIRELMDDLE